MAGAALAGTLPAGFNETTVWSGLGNPTVIRFAPDGRVFVASKSGIINVFDSLGDTTPTVYADLRTRVHDFWDRGLLGVALDPQFTTGRPYVYVLYAYDKAPNSTQQPRWGDGCATPPGATADGCVITGRLSRLSATGTETVLIEDFCQQYPSHSVGSIDFGPDGMLYVSSGDGASFNWADYGQDGSPVNPCGDPPGGTLTPPTSQGGALRAQSFRRPATQAASLDGAILRVNPDTGAAAAGNPAIANADPQRRRIVAYGFRNPFRFTFRPGTGEIWSGDVGWNTWEEINRTPDVDAGPQLRLAVLRGHAADGLVRLAEPQQLRDAVLGGRERRHRAVLRLQPLREGRPRRDVHDRLVVGLRPGVLHRRRVPGRSTRTRCSSATTRATASGSSTRARTGCRTSPRARPSSPAPPGPVFLTQGPDGALYYADLAGGTVRRVAADNNAPTARITADPASGVAPLTVAFSGTTSSDPEGQALTLRVGPRRRRRLRRLDRRRALVHLRVRGHDHRAPARQRSGRPAGHDLDHDHGRRAADGDDRLAGGGTTWAVGDTISFSGSARNSAGATLPASALRWSLSLRHCSRDDASVCHTHAIQDYVGVASGSFVAPDHEYPSHLLLSLTARDAAGLETTETVRLDPRTANLALATSPTGLQLSLGSDTLVAPFTRTVIARSVNTVTAPDAAGARRRQLPVRLLERRARRDARDHRARVRHRDLHGDVHRAGRRAGQPGRRRRDRHQHLERPSRAAARSTGRPRAAPGVATSLRLYLDGTSQREPARCSASTPTWAASRARCSAPARSPRRRPGAWNTVALAPGVPI